MPPDRAGADAAAQAFDAAMASNSLCEEIGAAVSERMRGGSGAGSVSQLISSRCAALYPEQGGAEAGDADCAFLDQAQASSCALEAGELHPENLEASGKFLNLMSELSPCTDPLKGRELCSGIRDLCASLKGDAQMKADFAARMEGLLSQKEQALSSLESGSAEAVRSKGFGVRSCALKSEREFRGKLMERTRGAATREAALALRGEVNSSKDPRMGQGARQQALGAIEQRLLQICKEDAARISSALVLSDGARGALSGQPARSPGEGMMPPPSSISATPLWG